MLCAGARWHDWLRTTRARLLVLGEPVRTLCMRIFTTVSARDALRCPKSPGICALLLAAVFCSSNATVAIGLLRFLVCGLHREGRARNAGWIADGQRGGQGVDSRWTADGRWLTADNAPIPGPTIPPLQSLGHISSFACYNADPSEV